MGVAEDTVIRLCIIATERITLFNCLNKIVVHVALSSSIHDGIYEPGKTHMLSTPSLGSVPIVDFLCCSA